ncbi:MAG: caspase family protein [Caulobacteraceae bacterium]|nr:caspase family protein [Caulobacteraceae bacterium]
MTRALIAIGVDTYDHVGGLGAAEHDAKEVFDELIKAEVGAYDPAFSRLLLSPTLALVRSTVEEVVLGGVKFEELTFFFAGHGMIQPVGFYMAMRDTRLDRATATAFSLSELFAQIAEASPLQTNVIIDACFSGGLVADLQVLTRPETSGYVGSPAVTLLAMSARNQEAGEYENGGIGTSALLDCIKGRALVREDVGALELFDIGQVVINRVQRSGEQNPVLSVLNVHRRSKFCRNPLFHASSQSTLKKWEPRAFLDAVEPVLASHAHDPADLIADVERLFGHLIAKADDSRDVFKGLELRATASIALLSYADFHPEIRSWLLQSLSELVECLHHALAEAVEALLDNKYAMLAGPGGMANLYLLPIRLSKLLGWAGAAFHIGHLLGQQSSFPRDNFKRLLELVTEHYRLSLVSMSDSQSPYLAMALTAAAALDLGELGEAVASSLFNSYVECGARVASTNIDASRILAYLLARQSGSFDGLDGQIAQPNELGVVLLLAAPLFDLTSVFDDAMSSLDHVALSAFVPDDYTAFAQETINEGENSGFMIGHDIWTVADLQEHFPHHAFQAPTDATVAGTAILASLVFPDRVPWFVFGTSAPSRPIDAQTSAGGNATTLP